METLSFQKPVCFTFCIGWLSVLDTVREKKMINAFVCACIQDRDELSSYLEPDSVLIISVPLTQQPHE